MTVRAQPRQLALTLPHAESFARDDFLAGPANKAALALVDAWPDWLAARERDGRMIDLKLYLGLSFLQPRPMG